MSQDSRGTRVRALALAVAAGYAVAAWGGAADSTGPGGGNGNTPAANDLYVSVTTGNDAGGGTQQRPFRTIAAALAALGARPARPWMVGDNPGGDRRSAAA